MLQAEDLTLWRGSNRLFEHLSFAVPQGRMLLVKGPNGSGKTTLLRVLCGLTRPESGRVLWDGGPLAQGFPPRLAYCGHPVGLKPELTVRQNLVFCAQTLGVPRDAWWAPTEQLGLAAYSELEVRHLSAGQKRRVALARVLLSTAVAWLLDEPFTNLDSAGRRLVEMALARHLDSGGLAVVAAHHDLQVDGRRVQRLVLGANR